MAAKIDKISPCLWFDTEAEEAAEFYCGIFEDSEVGDVTLYPKGAHDPDRVGQVMTVSFTLAGRHFTALNGGPQFPFTEATSLTVLCQDQSEVDRYWEALQHGGGKEVQCGWLKDRYGLSWQIVPEALIRMISDPDPLKAERVMHAMLNMVKLDIATLERAWKG